MSKLDHDEILTKYAELTKESADWVDVFQALGLDALIGAGIGAGAAALSGGSIGAGILSGIGVPTAIGFWPITLAVVGAAGIGYTIYEALQHTDDNLEDLIGRLEALDPNDQVAGQLDGFISEFKGMQDRKLFEPVSYSTDPKIKVQQMAQQMDNLQAFHDKVAGLTKAWPTIKSGLTDMGFDPGQAQTAIIKTYESTRQQIADIKAMIQEEATKSIQTTQKESKGTYMSRDELMYKYSELLKESASFWGLDLSGWAGKSLQLLGLAIPGVGLGIVYNWLTKTANVLDKLEKSIDTLDPAGDDRLVRAQTDWLTQIGTFKGRVAEKPPVDPSPQVQATWAEAKAADVLKVMSFLNTLKKAFAGVKGDFRGFGAGAVEKEIDNTITSINTILKETQARAQSKSQELVQELGPEISGAAQEILNLHTQLSNIYQGKVQYAAGEKKILDLASSVVTGKASPSALVDGQRFLVPFKNMLQEALTVAQRKKPAQIKLISKRALKTPGGIFTMKGLPREESAEPRAVSTNPVVKSIQEALNTLNTIYQLGFAALNADGIYGPKTRDALLALISRTKNPEGLGQFSTDQIKDLQFMRSTDLRSITAILNSTIQASK